MTEHDSAPREFEGRLASGKDWREIVAWVGDLPPMPHVASRAISMVEDPDTTASDLTDLLSTDPALAARVLKIANSAMFARQREITTLNQAIMIIGFKALKGIVVAATLRQLNKSFGKLQQLIWENSMATAMASNILARRLGRRYFEEIFLLGLLHSLGQIVLLVQEDTAKEYSKVLDLIKTEQLDFVAAEQRVYGFAHPLIGALVAKKWNFSADTCQIILHYADTVEGSGPDNQTEEKTVLVQLSDLVVHAADIGNPPGYPCDMLKLKPIAEYLGFDPKTSRTMLEEVILETREQFDRERHAYG